MEWKQIRDLTKEWIEEHYNLRVTETNYGFYTVLIRWRNITI
jgi:hypothetical protein